MKKLIFTIALCFSCVSGCSNLGLKRPIEMKRRYVVQFACDDRFYEFETDALVFEGEHVSWALGDGTKRTVYGNFIVTERKTTP